MSSLVIGAPVAPVALSPEASVTNDGWFPSVDPAGLRRAQRIRDGVTPERLRAAIVGAIITVNNQLAVWQVAQTLAGRLSLGEVPGAVIDGRSRYVLLYERAIGAYTKAELVEGYRDTDITGAGERQIDAMDPAIGELRRTGVQAIRDMLGTTRVSVELI